MIMRSLLFKFGIVLVVFGAGVVSGVVWKSRRSHVSIVAPIVQVPDEKPWPLTREIVSRSLQSHSFRTDKLRRNSNEEVVWRWLKESVANYPQNRVKLNILDIESYGIVLYPEKLLDSTTLRYYNRELSEK